VNTNATALPRVIAADLDRTLLGPGGILTDRTRKALDAARDAEIIVLAVTARSHRVFEVWTDLARSIDAAICTGGTSTYVPGLGILRRIPLDPAAALEAAERLRAANPTLRFAVEAGDVVHAEADYTRADSVRDHRVHHPTLADALAAAPALKLYVHTPGGSSAELKALADSLNLQDVSVWASGSHDQIALGPARIDKATALAGWCEARGIPAADVAAFGDAPADAPMLEWAGRSWAVANAGPEARAAAKAVCASNAEDGVAEVIEQLLHP
jgi:HAD superfamily hydrolase (TIGR01484 family)